MRKLALLAALLLAPAAGAGGFATVQLTSLPTGIEAGGTWTAELLVKAHGRKALDGLTPYVQISGPGGRTERFPARPAGKTGVYRAEVVFPSKGTWSYAIWDGYSQTHTYKPIQVGAPAPGGGGFPVATLAIVLAAALALGASVYALLRRRSVHPDVGLAKS